MSKRVYSLLCIVVLLVGSMAPSFASEKSVRIQVRPASESIQAIRYQRGILPNQTWKNIPLAGALLELEDFASEEEFLFVQQAVKMDAWGSLFAYQYDKQEKSWSLVPYPPKTNLRFNIKASDGSVRQIRYQYGSEPDGSWQTATSSIAVEGFDSREELLFVQQAVTEDSWSGTYTYRYDYINGSWSLLPPEKPERQPSHGRSFDVKGYGLLPAGRSSNFYSYLLGGGIQMNGPLGKVLGHTALTFSKGPAKSAWVKSQQSLGLSLGMADPIRLSDKVDIIPELGYGVIFHFLEADFDKDGTYSLEFFVDQQVRFSLYLTYALNAGQKLFIAPLAVAFFEKNDFGFMYGCQAGLRISL